MSAAGPGDESVALLRQLVAIPSVSGSEQACRDALAAWLEAHGIAPQLHGRNVLATLDGRRQGPGLLFCSHIDVVPVGPGWTREPWDAALENGRVHGRGSNDAKSSVAAMAVAASRLLQQGFDGRLVLAFVCDEETGGEGIEACAGDLPPCDAAVVGEPTGLDVCPGQRGLLRARLVAHGRSCHASRPHEGHNAIEMAARDIVALGALDLGEAHPLLGRATLQATVIAGGTRSNVIPGECTVELDGRPTPQCDNQRMLALVDAATESEVVLKSTRMLPVVTDPDEPIIAIARRCSPTGLVRGFGGVSDLAHLRGMPGVVMGPGTSAASHAPDEWVAVEQVQAATAAYLAIAREFLAAGGRSAHDPRHAGAQGR